MPDHPVASPARELTKQEHATWAATCSEIEARIRAGLRASAEAIWATAQALHEFDEQSGWFALGFDSKSAWLAQPGIELSYDQYQRLVRVYRETAVLRRADFAMLQRLDLSKVDLVLPAVKDGRAQLPAALNDVATKTARQMREQYASPNGHHHAQPEDEEDDMPSVEPVEEPPEEEPVEEPFEIRSAENPPATTPLTLNEARAELIEALDLDQLHRKLAMRRAVAAIEAHMQECAM